MRWKKWKHKTALYFVVYIRSHKLFMHWKKRFIIFILEYIIGNKFNQKDILINQILIIKSIKYSNRDN